MKQLVVYKRQSVEITTEYIKLDSLLKLSGAVETGGEAKLLIQDGGALLNGEPCVQRGKKLRPGDEIKLPELGLKLLVEKAAP